MTAPWYVYVLRCADGSLYTGVTTDVERRVAEHNGSGRRGARYTRARRPVVLALAESAADRAAATRREAAIKRLPRADKERLLGLADGGTGGPRPAVASGTLAPDPECGARPRGVRRAAAIDLQTRPPMLADRFRALAADLRGIDLEVYRDFAKDPLEPVIGLGDPDCRVAFFGRDPGRDEVQHAMPFIGAGGQKVRSALYRHLYGADLPGFDASVEVGRHFFWANTVPYKPLGNKAWSTRVKQQFQPLVAELLLTAWRGRDVITLGREAFLWFGINQSKAVKAQLEAFWAEEGRFTGCTEVELAIADGSRRCFRLHPLPHPSPLNATWYKLFPELLTARLVQLEVRPENLRLLAAA